MEDFEEKYSLFIKYMLPPTNKCIKSVEFDGFISGYEVLGVIPSPNDEYEPETHDMFNSITPKINIEVFDKCLSWTPFVMGLKGDILGTMIDLHKTYFPDKQINAHIKYINII